MTLCVFFVQLWGMPLMFIVAGAGVWHSLRARTPRAFVLERLRRLLVPLLVGIALVVPPQVYFALLAGTRTPVPTGSSSAASSTSAWPSTSPGWCTATTRTGSLRWPTCGSSGIC
jgi:hypothetical protein